MAKTEPARNARDRLRLGVALLLVFAATAAVYLQAPTNNFVGIDDDVYVTANPLITSLGADSLKTILTRPYAEFYHPITLISLAIDHRIWGLNPLGYHLTDLLLHLLNTLLVFWIAYLLVQIAARKQNATGSTGSQPVDRKRRRRSSAANCRDRRSAPVRPPPAPRRVGRLGGPAKRRLVFLLLPAGVRLLPDARSQ